MRNRLVSNLLPSDMQSLTVHLVLSDPFVESLDLTDAEQAIYAELALSRIAIPVHCRG